jgi:penicillin-binding protein 1A
MQPFGPRGHQLLQQLSAFAKKAFKAVKVLIVQYRQRVKAYYQQHPRQKKRHLIALAIFGPPLLFLMVVWIEIPSRRALRNIQNQLPSEVYSADSVLLGRFYIQDRTEIEYEQIPEIVKNALVATEDVRFYEHGGVDYESLGRVLVRSILMGDESSGGGSTITQQLAKNLYPRKKYWILSMLLNKSREILTAIRIENIYSKEQVITMYLNTVSFADQTYGIETAAKRFFSVSAKDLNTQSAALLVGMLKATHSYNPRLFPDRALQRRNIVLSQMTKYGFLPGKSADSIKKLPIALKYSKQKHNQGLAPYFREYLRTELQEWLREHPNEDDETYNNTDGLKIYTTIHSSMQRYAEKAMEQQMTELQKQFFAHWGRDGLFKENKTLLEDAMKRSNRYKRLKEEGFKEEDIKKEFDRKVPMRLFSWQGEREVIISPMDSIRQHIQFLNAGFVVMEPHTGNVLVWVGGIDHDFFQYDHVRTSTKRQVGSVFKPFVYAMAVEKGENPCNLVSAHRETYIDKEGEEWTPRNSQNDYEVKYTMRGALAYSVNTVAVKMILKAGVDNTIKLAHDMGVESELPDVPSIALGSSSVSLMEMTSAYASFANNGIPVRPVMITSIIDTKGRRFEAMKPESITTQPVLSKKSIAITREMLRTVIHEGTASRIRWRYGVYADMAGKTGTTQGNADGWFIVFTPNLVMGAWVGADDQRVRFRTTELGQGASTALPIAGYFMKQMLADKHFKDLTDAKFESMDPAWQKELDCDLYELDSTLIDKINRITFARDSTLQADTTAILAETFLEQLYNRKLKLMRLKEQRDSLLRRDLIEAEEVDN